MVAAVHCCARERGFGFACSVARPNRFHAYENSASSLPPSYHGSSRFRWMMPSRARGLKKSRAAPIELTAGDNDEVQRGVNHRPAR